MILLDGPFAKIAQQYELSQKQQEWDIIHGNAQFDDKGNLIGGQAFADQQRALQLHDMLKGAGLETPAMKMADMQKSISTIDTNIAALLAAAQKDGIVIADKGN